MLRLMRENYERGLYEGEEYQYWQKVSALKEKLALLERVPEPALNRAARTLLNLRETWESTTKEEGKDLVHIMIQEVGVDVVIKRVLWVKAPTTCFSRSMSPWRKAASPSWPGGWNGSAVGRRLDCRSCS